MNNETSERPTEVAALSDESAPFALPVGALYSPSPIAHDA